MLKNNTKIILGINWEQNSTASLMINGEIVACSSEERFTGKKNDESYPKNAINFILKKFRIHPKSIDAVCFISKYWSPSYILVRHYTNFSIQDHINEQNDVWYPRIYKNQKKSLLKIFKKKIDLQQYPGKKYWKKKIRSFLNSSDHVSNKRIKIMGQKIRAEVLKKHMNINKNKVHFIKHSFGHAAYAYCSGSLYNKNASIMTVDAFGDFINYSYYKFFKKNKHFAYKLISEGGNCIIARMYRYSTLLLGFKPNEHEYKIMGMAPYCKEKYLEKLFNKFKTFQTVKGKNFFNKSMPKDSFFYLKKIFNGYRFDSIAGALQKYTEYLLGKWINNCISQKKYSNIGIAGGVAMNVKANLEISKSSKVSSVYVPPSPDDSSQAMGACYGYSLKNNLITNKLKNSYLGYEISDHKVKNILKTINKKKFNIYKKNIVLRSANLLKKNKLIAICKGKAEFGARSLGNRSLVCNPKDRDNIKKINETVKNRDFWMPFAATVIDKYAKKYFLINKKTNLENYKYMTNCLDTTNLGRKNLIAATHPYDNTCRPQILHKNDNKFYYNIIEQFGKISKTYALLNTSLNTHGKPIINDEKQALKIFYETNIDALILGDFLIEKK